MNSIGFARLGDIDDLLALFVGSFVCLVLAREKERERERERVRRVVVIACGEISKAISCVVCQRTGARFYSGKSLLRWPPRDTLTDPTLGSARCNREAPNG